jgi:hypothetical protein
VINSGGFITKQINMGGPTYYPIVQARSMIEKDLTCNDPSTVMTAEDDEMIEQDTSVTVGITTSLSTILT